MLKEICTKYQSELEQIKKGLFYGHYDELDQDNFESEVVIPFEDNFDGDFSWGWDNGASKGVFIFKDFGFVIKIPFNYIDGDKLCGVVDGDNEWDYCSQEANRYTMAENEGLKNVFLETKLLGMMKGHPIYIQPFGEPINKINVNSYRSSTKDDIEKVRTIVEEEFDYDYIDAGWEADLLVLYGEEYYKKFKCFINDTKIEDLRTANIGYFGKYPIILDYAGFDY